MKEKIHFIPPQVLKVLNLKFKCEYLVGSPNLNITRNYVTTIEFFNKFNVSIDFVFAQFVVLVSL